jgi:hypothetical protein
MSSTSPSLVYHYTDTARLPWILNSGLLMPGRNQIGGYPDPDFLWATTSPDGDGSASASREAFRSGLTQMVRFVLHTDDFEPWPTIVERSPQWTPDIVAQLENAARGKSSPAEVCADWEVCGGSARGSVTGGLRRPRERPPESCLRCRPRGRKGPAWEPAPGISGASVGSRTERLLTSERTGALYARRAGLSRYFLTSPPAL